MIKKEPLTAYAMCRECAKEFGILNNGFEGMIRRMEGHVLDFPGHTIIGTEQLRFIVKGEVCIVN